MDISRGGGGIILSTIVFFLALYPVPLNAAFFHFNMCLPFSIVTFKQFVYLPTLTTTPRQLW